MKSRISTLQAPVPRAPRAGQEPLRGALRWPPAQEQVFEQHDDADTQRREDRNGQERREYERGVHVELRRQDEVADPAVAADEFAYDRPDERQRKGDLERVRDVGQSVHQPHPRKYPPFAAAGDLREVEHVFLDLAEPGERIHEHGEDRQQEGEKDLRFDAETEPDDEKRGDRNLWNTVE